MKIAVISDLHLGRGDAADSFGHDDAEFLRFLDFLEGEFERIVLLGDIYETLTSPKPLAHVEELTRCKEAHREIAERFARPNYRYIHGNHDLVAAHVDGAPSDMTIKVDGVKVLFTHGHHHDWLVRRLRWLSEAGVWVGGWLLRMGVESIIRFFDRWNILDELIILFGLSHPRFHTSGWLNHRFFHHFWWFRPCSYTLSLAILVELTDFTSRTFYPLAPIKATLTIETNKA